MTRCYTITFTKIDAKIICKLLEVHMEAITEKNINDPEYDHAKSLLSQFKKFKDLNADKNKFILVDDDICVILEAYITYNNSQIPQNRFATITKHKAFRVCGKILDQAEIL